MIQNKMIDYIEINNFLDFYKNNCRNSGWTAKPEIIEGIKKYILLFFDKEIDFDLTDKNLLKKIAEAGYNLQRIYFCLINKDPLNIEYIKKDFMIIGSNFGGAGGI